MDQPENFRWNGDIALDGELVYASGQTNIALQKPTFSIRVEEQAVTISDLKAGLWDGSLDVARIQVHLPSKEKKLRIETQLILDGARSQSIINSFSEAQTQPAVIPLNWTGAWQISGWERSRWISLRTFAGMATRRSAASLSTRAAKQTSHCRSQLSQYAWRSRR